MTEKEPTHAPPQLNVGVPGLNVSVPLQKRLWHRFLGFFKTKSIEQSMAVFLDRIIFFVPSHDEGHMDVYMKAVNLGKGNIKVEAVHLDWIAVSNGGLDDRAAHLSSPGLEVQPTHSAKVHFRLKLGSSGVRRLFQAVGKASNPYSSPAASTSVKGKLRAVRKGKEAWVPFELSNVVPLLTLDDSSSPSSG